jgi:hypothetical protein
VNHREFLTPGLAVAGAGALPKEAWPVPITRPTPRNTWGGRTHWVIVDSSWASAVFGEDSPEQVGIELKPATGGGAIKCPR